MTWNEILDEETYKHFKDSDIIDHRNRLEQFEFLPIDEIEDFEMVE